MRYATKRSTLEATTIAKCDGIETGWRIIRALRCFSRILGVATIVNVDAGFYAVKCRELQSGTLANSHS